MGLGSVLASSAPARSIKDLVKLRYSRDEPILPMGAGDWIRVSSLPSMCPREEVIVSRKKIIRQGKVDVDLNLTFSHGTGLHGQLQNDVLPLIDILYGQWQCVNCGSLYGGRGKDVIKRPKICPRCPQVPLEPWERSRFPKGQDTQPHEFRYKELWYGDDNYLIGGHPDGFISLPGMSGLGVLEAKSISSKSAKDSNIKSIPDIGHVVQLQAYLWLTGLQWGRVLYWDKGVYGLPGWYEHAVERDNETIDRIKELCLSIRSGLEKGIAPPRICASSDCKRAEECAQNKLCFELPEVVTLEEAA